MPRLAEVLLPRKPREFHRFARGVGRSSGREARDMPSRPHIVHQQARWGSSSLGRIEFRFFHVLLRPFIRALPTSGAADGHSSPRRHEIARRVFGAARQDTGLAGPEIRGHRYCGALLDVLLHRLPRREKPRPRQRRACFRRPPRTPIKPDRITVHNIVSALSHDTKCASRFYRSAYLMCSVYDTL